MARKALPRATRDAVLREFNHRCAICGGDGPQLHHIDEDPTNNSPENLIPLCPNCHLRDQHNPTAPVDVLKLSLFRNHRDPLILSPQFEPLFRRMRFLLELNDQTFDMQIADSAVNELVQFVSQLEMGSFYAKRLESLLYEPPAMRAYTNDTPDYLFQEWEKEDKSELFSKLTSGAQRAVSLIVELLRYQPWKIDRDK